MALQFLACLPLLAVIASAQDPSPDSLEALHQAFQQKRLALAQSDGGFEAQRKLTEQFADDLEAFVSDKATGMARFNGRLMLVDYRLGLGQPDRAKAALAELDAASAPPMVLIGAAEFAQHVDMKERGQEWIEQAIERAADFETRAAIALHLMTRLQMPERGEHIFSDAFAAATDDEQRARVRWYQAMALREREDLPENTFDKELEKLAKSYPDTFYGGVARDRTAARELKVGADSIDFSVTDLDGNKLTLSDLRGKVVLLDFWASWCGPCLKAAPDLVAMYEKYHDKGLEIISISLDDDVTRMRRVIETNKMTWHHVGDGKGSQTEVALRYNVELPPRLLLIGRDGTVSAMHLYPHDRDGVAQTEQAIEAALEKDG